jgi:hypothetical protein
MSSEVPIRQGLHLEWYRDSATRTVGELVGESAIVWSDCRSGDRGVYMQVFDVEGNPKYEENGILVADRFKRQEDASVAPCDDGGWFVAWEDFAVDTLGNIRCTKISSDGEILWGDGESGVSVCLIPAIQRYAKIMDDGDGGCVIVWLDRRSGEGDIYAQRILNNGHPDGRWEQNGIPVAAVRGFQGNLDITYVGENGVIIVWQDDGIQEDMNIRAQRLTPQGDLLWGGGEGIQVCNQEGGRQELPKICSDGEGGAFVSWQDNRNMEESNRDIYVQRIDNEGNLLWSESDEGIPLCTASEEQNLPRIIESEPGSAIVVWQDMRQDQDTYDIYGMRIGGEDEMVRLWEGEQGIPISVAEGNQQGFRINSGFEGGAFIVWEDNRFGGFPEVDIWAQQISVDGEIQWDENGIVVCGAAEEGDDGLFTQGSPVIFATADQSCVIVWGDQRSGSRSIFSQKLNPEGESQWEENGVQLFEGMDYSTSYHQIHSIGHGEFVITWLDGRHQRNTIPYIQYCTSDVERIMNTEFSTNGIPVIEPNENSAREAFSFVSEDNSTILVWEDSRRGQQSIYAQRISQQGERLWGEAGILCVESENRGEKLPYACTDGNGGFIVAWREDTNNTFTNIHSQRLDENGRRLWGNDGVLLTGNDVDERVAQVIPDGEGGAVIVWEANVPGTEIDLRTQRIDANGRKLWEEDLEYYGKYICFERRGQYLKKLLHHPQGYVVGWTDGRDFEDGSQYDIYGQFILHDGSDLWEEDGFLISGSENDEREADVAIDNEGFIWIIWEDARYEEDVFGRDIYMQKLDHQPDDRNRPREFYEQDGIPVCHIRGDQRNPTLTHDGQNGVWIAWEDYRNGVWSDVYATHLNPGGEPYDPWEGHGSIISNAYHKQVNPQLTLLNENGDGGVIVLWEDKRCTGHNELVNLYCQLLDDDLVSVQERVITSPSKFILYPAYPNPFNSTTTIEYSLPYASQVSLNLYSLSGQRIEMLVSGRMQAGVHRTMLDAGDMASGLYFVKLEGVGQSVTQKIMLIK